MEIKLKFADESDSGLWDKIVDSSPQGTLFHSWKWLKIAERHTNTRLYPLMGIKGETIIGILPLFSMKKTGISAAFSPPPSTAIPYLGPVIKDYEIFNQSKRESMERKFQIAVDDFLFSQLKCGYVLQSLTPYHDPRPYKWSHYLLQPIFDYHLNLSQTLDSVWNNMSGALRSEIRRTEKHGITIRDGTKADLNDIFESLLRRYNEQGKSITITQEYLIELYQEFSPSNFKIFTAEENGKPVSGIIIILFKNRALYWVGGAKPVVSNFSPNDSAQWAAIQYAHTHGCTIYEEIGAGTERLSKFKAKYNPRLVTRFSVKKYSSAYYHILEKGYSSVMKKVIKKLV